MTKEDVLKLLQGGGYVSGQRMSEQLGLSRAAIWKAIDRLRAEGYTIDSATNRGYCLTGTPNRLTQAGVERALGDHPWRALVEVLPAVYSLPSLSAARVKAPAVSRVHTVVRAPVVRSIFTSSG